MKEINIISDLLDKYSEEEIISYLTRIMNGVLKNYRTAIQANQPEVLWGSLGDLEQVTSILRGMDKAYKMKLAQKDL